MGFKMTFLKRPSGKRRPGSPPKQSPVWTEHGGTGGGNTCRVPHLTRIGFLMTFLKRAFSKTGADSISPTNQSSVGSYQPAQYEQIQPLRSDVSTGLPNFVDNHPLVESSTNPAMNQQQQSDEDWSMDPIAVESGVQIVPVALSVQNPVSIGPFGGSGGDPFDDGIDNMIKQVVITWGSGIDKIIIEYVRNGLPVWTEHGGTGGGNTCRILLDYPNEFLISVSGYCGTVPVLIHDGNKYENRNITIVRSITFESNRRTYGPFGMEEGNYFLIPPTGGKIVGFHGSSGIYLDSIGAYFEPLSNS